MVVVCFGWFVVRPSSKTVEPTASPRSCSFNHESLLLLSLSTFGSLLLWILCTVNSRNLDPSSLEHPLCFVLSYFLYDTTTRFRCTTTMPTEAAAAAATGSHNNSSSSLRSNDDPDTLRIMVSTDNHLGYAERDNVRGMDSFSAFEEVLYLSLIHI